MFKLFKDKGFWKNALTLAIPVALQNMLISSYTLFDTLLVSRLGDVSLSAVGMVGQWGFLMNMFVIGIASGTTVFVSQYWGIKNKKKIRTVCGIALLSSMAVALVFTVISLAAPHFVVGIFNKDEKIIEEGTRYLLWVSLSYFAVIINNVLSTVLRSTEEVRLPMYVSAFTTVLNIILDYCMIFGKFGFPEMKIEGAAIATSISAWLGVLIIALVSIIKKNILFARLKEFFVFSLEDVKVFAKRAVPIVCNEGLWGLGTFVFNIIFANMGYEYYAAVTIHKSFENMAFVFFVGLCSASTVMIGKSIGQGKIKRGIDDAKRFAIAVPLTAVIVGTIVIIFRKQLVGIFNMSGNISEVTLSSAIAIMTIYAVELPVRIIPYIQIVGIFRSGGDTVNGVKYDLFTLWGLSIPATAIAVYVFKVPFVVAYAIMYIFDDYVKMFLCIRHFRSYKWIKPVTEEGKKALIEFNSQKSLK